MSFYGKFPLDQKASSPSLELDESLMFVFDQPHSVCWHDVEISADPVYRVVEFESVALTTQPTLSIFLLWISEEVFGDVFYRRNCRRNPLSLPANIESTLCAKSYQIYILPFYIYGIVLFGVFPTESVTNIQHFPSLGTCLGNLCKRSSGFLSFFFFHLFEPLIW